MTDVTDRKWYQYVHASALIGFSSSLLLSTGNVYDDANDDV